MSKLSELAKADPKVILIVGDLGYSVVEEFANQFPGQFLNAGIAEQNMMGMG
jgi:transketolase